ncbi:Mitochondrial N-glutamine methyltransferase MTQ1 [Golovinomyces cichoracearum]|uniref:Mitochondrial N-glutamine methyltransferase MTQ1 n=1 Tax=Golovinomyces cichoracearum TaxID=62708 RepID=A0A420IJA9_9PEZI|nr:Mitochondrial N-glutamine methyltransferase MTQ1 [Golovinomyces cichoracearum]
MPRLVHSIIRKASKISPFLPLILQATRHLPSAINELRWLKEYARELKPNLCPLKAKLRLLELVKRRAGGEPLQYILGSQPFGNLDIKCERGVLIPRPETEAYTLHLANLIKNNKLHPSITKIFSQKDFIPKQGGRQYPPKIRILDACTGTGAIALLLRSALTIKGALTSNVFILGIDNSQKAIDLACQNRSRNEQLGQLPPDSDRKIYFEKRDIFEPYRRGWDIIISNPPYISHQAFDFEIGRSVRDYEPKSALVPPVPRFSFGLDCEPEDVFYKRLILMHDEAVSKILLLEVGDVAQAIRVVKIIDRYDRVKVRNRIEFWRDNPAGKANDGILKQVNIEGNIIKIKGEGKIRSVILIRNDLANPTVGRDFKIKHLRLQQLVSTKPPKPIRQVFGPPELRATWKYLNSPQGTEGRAARAMGRGWGPQNKSMERIYAQKKTLEEFDDENRRSGIAAINEMERPIKMKRALKQKGKFSPSSEPFLIKPYR